jgi:D-3-phosphoglycerate dehydrogenase
MADGRWRVLNMADVSAFPDVFEHLLPLADVVTLEPDQRALAEHVPHFDAYFASLHVRLTEDIIGASPRLRAIVTPSTGLDHIDMAASERAGITVLSLRGETEFLDSITCTAEMAWGLMLSVVRRIPWSFDAAKRGEWARDRFRGHQLAGKTFGTLGYGRLGRIVAQYARAFRMRVLACDVRAVEPEPGVELVDLQTLLRESDVLAINIHLTDENRHLMGADEFARMKPTAWLINTSRGGIIDEEAFVAALEKGAIAGAGVDVIEGEWRDDLADHPLIRYANAHENLVISPHTGGVTVEAQRMTIEFMVRKLVAFMEARDDQE